LQVLAACGGCSDGACSDRLRAANKTTSRQPTAGRLICGLAAGPLPAQRRGTRCKYVLVSSYAASMPRKVPRRWAGKDQSRWSACMGLNTATSGVSGAVSSPLAGPCGGMDAATEPPGMDSRRVPRAVRAPRIRPTQCLIWTSDCIHQDTADKTTALTDRRSLARFC
jgi:hypothetical protein